ncbi:MAG TPA: plastocyanin/azurin family copper-binding protein, partial [Candidatus Angelobacter sp.]|nr:plastocyanin/azurin family copper-binding protein [Candidatus Angelobacter sp.]
KFQFTFKDAGEYPYFCKLHPKMTGKIIVRG